jgi:carbamoylphosphate synthase small subunit
MVGLDLAREVTPAGGVRARADRRRHRGPTIALIDTGVKRSITRTCARAARLQMHPCTVAAQGAARALARTR